jgi:arsenate reductase
MGTQSVKATIYHNPACGTSRKALGILRERGIDTEVIEYLKTPPTREALGDLLKSMGMRPRDILRKSGTPYDELGLDDPTLSDEALFDAIEKHPILMQRPIVISPKGARLCRPLERIEEILPVA